MNIYGIYYIMLRENLKNNESNDRIHVSLTNNNCWWASEPLKKNYYISSQRQINLL